MLLITKSKKKSQDQFHLKNHTKIMIYVLMIIYKIYKLLYENNVDKNKNKFDIP